MRLLPNLLASPRGRLAAFFLLYITEGVPLGFAGTAVAFHLREMGMGPAEVGAFVGSLYLPWAFKWLAGPVVDVFRSRLLGHYRAWILVTQVLMVITMLALAWVPLPGSLALFSAILFVHNFCGATQDVAIDALACNTLREDERGLANGLMFAGAAMGMAAGGAGVLALTEHAGFISGFYLVAAVLAAVTVFVVLPMREPMHEETPAVPAGQRLQQVGVQMRNFTVDAFRAFLGTRGAFAGVLFNLLPAGAMGLGMALRTSLSQELGMSKGDAASIELWSNIISAVGMVLGGWLSDRLGRRSTLTIYIVLMSLPTLWIAWQLQQAGYVMPRMAGEPVRAGATALISALWVASIAYQFCLGLMYGTRSAIMMDVTTPKVAGTQFTAYMAMANLALAYSATWLGLSAQTLGYPITFTLDALVGLLSCALIPWLTTRPAPERPGAPRRRARGLCVGLAALCLAWLPWALNPSWGGTARDVVGIFFGLGFVCAAVVLFAGAALLPRGFSTRLAVVAALGLVALLIMRKAGAPAWAGLPLAALGAAALLQLRGQDWKGLDG